MKKLLYKSAESTYQPKTVTAYYLFIIYFRKNVFFYYLTAVNMVKNTEILF